MAYPLSSKLAVAFLAVACAGGARAASADPVIIRSGGFSADYGDPAPPWQFTGDGFSFQMGFISTSEESYWGPFECVCRIGAPVDLSTRLQILSGNGDSTLGWWNGGVSLPAQIGGITYPVLYYTGELIFNAPSVPASEGTAEMTWLEQPFTFAGHLTAFTNPDFTGDPVFDWDLAGRGTAGVIFQGNYDQFGQRLNDELWLTAIRYSFSDDAAPVPEPSTLLLMGSALAGGLVRKLTKRTDT